MVGFEWTPYPLTEKHLRGRGPFRVVEHNPKATKPWTVRKPDGELYKVDDETMHRIVKKELDFRRRVDRL